jgi:hypothetical protein
MVETHRWKAVKVTVSEPDSGAVLEQRIVDNDYCLVTAGNRYVKSIQVMGRPGRATHMIAVAVHPPEKRERLSGEEQP